MTSLEEEINKEFRKVGTGTAMTTFEREAIDLLLKPSKPGLDKSPHDLPPNLKEIILNDWTLALPADKRNEKKGGHIIQDGLERSGDIKNLETNLNLAMKTAPGTWNIRFTAQGSAADQVGADLIVENKQTHQWFPLDLHVKTAALQRHPTEHFGRKDRRMNTVTLDERLSNTGGGDFGVAVNRNSSYGLTAMGQEKLLRALRGYAGKPMPGDEIDKITGQPKYPPPIDGKKCPPPSDKRAGLLSTIKDVEAFADGMSNQPGWEAEGKRVRNGARTWLEDKRLKPILEKVVARAKARVGEVEHTGDQGSARTGKPQTTVRADSAFGHPQLKEGYIDRMQNLQVKESDSVKEKVDQLHKQVSDYIFAPREQGGFGSHDVSYRGWKIVADPNVGDVTGVTVQKNNRRQFTPVARAKESGDYILHSVDRSKGKFVRLPADQVGIEIHVPAKLLEQAGTQTDIGKRALTTIESGIYEQLHKNDLLRGRMERVSSAEPVEKLAAEEPATARATRKEIESTLQRNRDGHGEKAAAARHPLDAMAGKETTVRVAANGGLVIVHDGRDTGTRIDHKQVAEAFEKAVDLRMQENRRDIKQCQADQIALKLDIKSPHSPAEKAQLEKHLGQSEKREQDLRADNDNLTQLGGEFIDNERFQKAMHEQVSKNWVRARSMAGTACSVMMVLQGALQMYVNEQVPPRS